jgi:hypothetical protein
MREMANSNIQLEKLQERDSGINERITLKWILMGYEGFPT